MAELAHAEEKHPIWPKDKIHAVAKMCEESGECLQAANDYTDIEGNKTENLNRIKKEAAQTGAMAIRLLYNIFKEEEEAGPFRTLSRTTRIETFQQGNDLESTCRNRENFKCKSLVAIGNQIILLSEGFKVD